MAVDLLSQSLYQGISLLWEKGQLTDLTLRCENQTFQAHRLVLAAHSSHLHHLLTESTDPVATLDMDQFNLSADSLQILLHYLYTGNIVVTEDSHRMLQAVAMTLNIKCLLTLLEAAKAEFVEQIPVVDAKGGEDISPNVVAKGGEDVEIKEETESTGSLRPEADSGSVRESVDNVSGASKTADNTAESLPQPSVSQYHVEAKVQVIIPEATLPVKRKRGRPPRSATVKSPTVKLTTVKSATPKSAKAKLATPKRTPKKIKKGDMEEDPEFIPETIGTVTLKKRKKVVKAKAKRGTRARKGKAETVVPKLETDTDPDHPPTSQPEPPPAPKTHPLPYTLDPPADDGTPERKLHRVMRRKGWRGDPVCDICGLKFASHLRCTQHIKSEHPERWTGSSLCPLCGQTFTRVSTWKEHMRDVHGDKVQCPHCDLLYSSRATLKVHIDAVHVSKMAPPQHICEVCGKKFFTNIRLWLHKQTHGDPQQCKVCGKKLTTPKNLSEHVRIVHLGHKPNGGRTFTCEICNKVLRSRSSYHTHVKALHTMNNDPTFLKFVCENCGSRFYNKYKLDRHMKSMHKLSLYDKKDVDVQN